MSRLGSQVRTELQLVSRNGGERRKSDDGEERGQRLARPVEHQQHERRDEEKDRGSGFGEQRLPVACGGNRRKLALPCSAMRARAGPPG